MKKEETISNLKAYLDGDTAIGNIIPLRSVLESAIKYLSEHSLPSNLDEAAEDRVTENGRFELTPSAKMRIDDIKFGAKWMAEQGWSIELEVKEDAGGYPYIDKHIELYDYDTDTPFAKKGDKVIMQIRKK